ncbi:MAG: 4-carboxymuconolactone decarboxylase [Mucilaginibacter sp.]|nr:4-carboxymuconolactone decarboxylase [Mucilaginibacter sp.]
MNSGDGHETDSSAASGGALRARAQGARSAELGEALNVLDPDLLAWADGFIFGDVWSGPGISFEDRMMVAIVSLASCGQLAQLRNYLHGALQAGIDPQRIQQALKMLVVYVGFPTALAALVVYQEVRAKYEPDQ